LEFHNEKINSVEHRPKAMPQSIEHTDGPAMERTCQILFIIKKVF